MIVLYIDKLKLFLGEPVPIANDIFLYSPKIKDISKVGENVYYMYLMFATFNREQVLNIFKENSLLNEESLSRLEQFDDYEVLTSNEMFLNQIVESLKFFIKKDIYYKFILTNNEDDYKISFFVNEKEFINQNNYKTFSSLVKEVNGIDSKKEKIEFKNERAKKKWERLQKIKQQYEKDKILNIKDICSILCNAEGNGINVFNIKNLTIYQIYEHFERLSIKEGHRRMVGVWANGLLDSSTKLQEWMVKTKL